MVERSGLEEQAQVLIAYRSLSSATGKVKERAQRRFEKSRDKIGEILKEGKRTLPKESKLTLELGWDDESIKGARKKNLAIREFKQKHPKYGKILQKLINKHRQVRRAYIEFGGEIPEEVYIGIIQEIMDIDYKKAEKIYASILEIEGILTPDGLGIQKSLLSE